MNAKPNHSRSAVCLGLWMYGMLLATGGMTLAMAPEGNGSATDTLPIPAAFVNRPPQFTLGPSPTVEEDGGPQWFENFVTSVSVGPEAEAKQRYNFFVTHDHPELFTVPPYVTQERTLTFTPAPDRFGEATVALTMQDNGGTDNGGKDSSTQTFILTVRPVNDAPQVDPPVVQAAKEGEITVLHTPFTDIDSSGPFSASIDWGDGTVTPGTILVASPMVATATHTYQGTGDYHLTLRVQDEAGGVGRSSVKVSIGNLTQLVHAGENRVADVGSTVQFSGQFTALNPFDTHMFQWDFGDGYTAEGTLTPSHSYGPEKQGRFTVTLTVTDDEGGSTTDELVVEVRAINDAPLLSPIEEQITLEDQVIDSIRFQATDPDGDELKIVAFSSDETKVPHENIAIVPLDNRGNHQLRIIPAPDRIGSVTVQLVADDGILQATSDFRLFLASVKDAPVFDLGADLLVYEDSGPMIIEQFAHGIWSDSLGADSSRLAFTVACDWPDLFQEPPGIDEKGRLSFVPAPHANGQTTVTVRLQNEIEGQEPMLSFPRTFVITLLPTPDSPVAYNDSITLAEDQTAALDVLANDTDADGESLSIRNYTQPSFGVVTGNDSETELVYRPRSNFSGLDTFTYTLEDESGAMALATVSVTVTPLNDFPFALEDRIETYANTAVAVSVLANDLDFDRDELTVFMVGAPRHGQAAKKTNEQIIYTPNKGYIGTDEFTYTIVDNRGGMDRATVTVTVREGTSTVLGRKP